MNLVIVLYSSTTTASYTMVILLLYKPDLHYSPTIFTQNLPQLALMDADQVMKLYDSYWFELQILKKQPSSSTSQTQETNPDHKIQNLSPKLHLPRVPSIHKRSFSDQFCSSNTTFDDFSCSPDSVLLPPKLKTILSGRDVTYEDTKREQGHDVLDVSASSIKKISTRKSRRARTFKGGKECKSLSDLEFEELKGFIDLGFVFSEEDKDSSLAKIIPALQRLRKHDEEIESDSANDDAHLDTSEVPRPYLSEAWDVLDRRKEEIQLKSWKIPALNNEIDMKDNLKWWAHTVVSTVR